MSNDDRATTDRASRLKALLQKKASPGGPAKKRRTPRLKEGELVAIEPGVYGLRLPNFSVLDHVNIWLLRGETGWIIVDTGAATEPVRAIWRQVLADLPETDEVEAIVVTHIHDDHFGNAGWLQEQTGAEVWMSELEWGFVQEARERSPQAMEEVWYAFFGRAGLTREEVRDEGLHRLDYLDARPLPEEVKPLVDGQSLEAAGRDWTVAIHAGHTAAHAMLVDSLGRLLLAADHGLKDYPIGLGPNPSDLEHDPVPGYRAALDVVADQREETLILCGHGQPWRGVDGVVQAARRRLTSRHESARSFFALDQARPALQWCQPLIERASSSHQKYLIYADVLGHLNHLVAAEVLRRQVDDQGVAHYYRVPDQD